MIFVAFGIGIIVVLALGWAWMVWGAGGRRRLPQPLPRQDLFGPQPRDLWPGSDVLVVDAGHVGTLTGGLVAGLCRHHRVILAAPPSLAIAPCVGGPVFRTSAGRSGGLDPQEVGDLYEVVTHLPGPPVVVVVAGEGAGAALDDIRAELPPDVDLRAILPRGERLPQGEGAGVEVQAEGDRFRIGVGDEAVSVVVGPRGLEAALG